MNARNSWSHFKENYHDFPGIGLSVDLSKMNFPAGFFQAMEPRMQQAFATVLKMPDVRDKLLGMGIVPVGAPPAEFQAFLDADRARFAKMYKLTGLTPE